MQSTRAQSLRLELVDNIGHHSPDMHMLVHGDVKFRVFRILRSSKNTIIPSDKAFYGQFAFQGGYDHPIMLGCYGAIHNQQIAVMDARV